MILSQTWVTALGLIGATLVGTPGSGSRTEPRFTDWGAPANLGPAVNSAAIDNGPAISKDGLRLYFSSTRPGGFGDSDIWISQRSSTDDAWGMPLNLGSNVNTAFIENVPSFSRDGHWMFFNSDHPAGLGGAGGLNNLDIWAAWRADRNDDFGWEPAAPLGPGVNSTFFDAGAGFLRGARRTAFLFFGSERPGGPGAADIYVTMVSGRHRGRRHGSVNDLSFSAPVLVAELSSPQNDARPWISPDGREVFLQSTRTGTLGANDLWASFRRSVKDQWPTPASLGPVVNSPSNDLQASLSEDRRTLFFASDRPGGSGDLDLYMTTRTRAGKQQKRSR